MQLRLSGTQKIAYVLARGVSAGMALVFALVYSKILGVENRSIVTIIFTCALISMTIFTSGLGLFLRSYIPRNVGNIGIRPLLCTGFISSFTTAIGTLIFLMFYSSIKHNIPITLIIFAISYSFFGALDELSHQLLVANGKFGVAAAIEIATLAVQVTLFSILVLFTQITPASALFLAFVTSYSVSIPLYFKESGYRKMPGHIDDLKSIKSIFKLSSPLHLVGISNGFADRLDRLFIGMFLPISFLGSYAVSTSLLTYLRFLPDAISRLIVARQNFGSIKKISESLIAKFFTFLLILVFIYLSVNLTQVFIVNFLGAEWRITNWIIGAFAIQEILRGFYLFLISRRVAGQSQKQVLNLSFSLILSSTISCFVGIQLFSGIGVPLGMATSYLLLISYSLVQHKLKVNT